MLRTITLAVGGLFLAAIAIAAADIPLRYAGMFPNAGNTTNISGVFSGTSLTLKYTRVIGSRFFQQTGNYACTNVPPDLSRCSGRRQTDDGQFGGREKVEITWKAGQPIRTHFHRM